MLNKKMFSVLGTMAVTALITTGLGASRVVSRETPSAAESSPSRLEGTWRVLITPPEASGVQPYYSYATFMRGGTLIGSGEIEGSFPSHGVWKKIGFNKFIQTFEKFELKDPTQPNLGAVVFKVVETFQLSGDSYTGVSQASFCDHAGQACQPLPGNTNTEGTRLKVDTDQSGNN